jgi:hypothetical protein
MKQALYVWRADDPEVFVMFGLKGYEDYERGIAVNPRDPCEFVAYTRIGHFSVWRLMETPTGREDGDNKKQQRN